MEVGDRFTRLLLIEKLSRARWSCLCDCGNLTQTTKAHLLRGTAKSCGCLFSEMRKFSLVGQRFGKLVVVEPSYKRSNHRTWRCQCDCGKFITTPTSGTLRRGNTTSCGCSRGISNTKHGHARRGEFSSEYSSWAGMLARCRDPKHVSFRHYGGRGIVVCDAWRDSFETFLADMGRRPSAKHSLDRKNNDGNYEPGNVRWSTELEQAQNTSNVRLIEYRGEIMSIAAWSRRLGLRRETINYRLNHGWSVEDAFTVQPSGGRRC